MVVRRTHLIAAAVLLVFAAAYFAQRTENRHALKLQRDTAITLCVADVERSSYIANGFRILAERVSHRKNPGDILSGKSYSAVERSIIGTFPGVAQRDAQVDRIETFNGNVIFRISEQGKALERQGCTEAFEKLPAAR